MIRVRHAVAAVALASGAATASMALLAVTHADAASAISQCQPLPAAQSTTTASASPTPTPSPTSPQVVLCVSVQRSSASVRHGQTADFTVRVWTENGSADAVTVTLATSPAGDDAAFSGLCPGGDGTSSCAVGDLATPVTPTSFVLTAQTAVLLNAGEVTLTVTAGAVTSPAMTAEPEAAATVSVAAPTVRSTRQPTRPSPTPAAATGAVPTLAPIPATGNLTSSIPSPASVSSLLSKLTPSAAATAALAPASPAPASSELAAAPASDALSSAPGAQAENGASGDSKWGPGALIVFLAGVVLLLGLGVTRYVAARRTRRPRPEPAQRHRRGSQERKGAGPAAVQVSAHSGQCAPELRSPAEGASELKTVRQPQPGEFLG